MARPRIKQFADDLEISYDKAKGLIEQGRSRRDGGAQVLERHMRNVPTAPKKKKKKMNRSPGKGVTARREKEKLTRIPGTPYMADSEQMEILRRQSPRDPMRERRTERDPIQRKKGGSQVGGMSVQEVMDVIERDTHMADQPKNREEKPQGCRGMGAAIKGGKFQGCK